MSNIVMSRQGNLGHGGVAGKHGAVVFYGDEASDVFELAEDPEGALRSAHERLRSRGSPGVCAAALAIRGDRVWLAWVGDCRIYRVRGGRAERLSRDQTLAEQLAAEGFAASGPLANVPLHQLGVGESLVVAVGEESVEAGDRFALATVGVWRDRQSSSVLAALCITDRHVAAETLVLGPSPLESTVVIVDVV